MDFFELVNTRCSIRVYQDQDVPEELVQKIMAAANRAPSAGNLQAFETVIVRDAATRQKLAESCFRQMFIATAPLLIIFFTNAERNREKYGALGESLLTLQDATIACAYAELAAKAAGLGACWIGGLNEEQVRQMVNAPASWKAVAMLTIGYPGENPDPRERRPLEELLNQELVK